MEDGTESKIAVLVKAAEAGDGPAANRLFAELYSQLRRLARRELARHGGPMTLSATTLLHQFYIDVAEREGPLFPDQGHFMAYAARAMRGLIIDYARNRQAQKRGGQFAITSLTAELAETAIEDRELTQISDALDELAAGDPRLAELVDLKFFCGFSFAEIAAMRSLSERTVQRDWEKARIYLYRSLQGDSPL